MMYIYGLQLAGRQRFFRILACSYVFVSFFQKKVNFFQVLERFLGTIPENRRYQQQILSMYLTCSGYTETSNKCLDR